MKIDLNGVYGFTELLQKEAEKQNILLDEEMLEKFRIYKDLLLEWNQKINLTAIVDEYEIIMKHFIDCLELVKYIEQGKNVIDVGTGAGFPGIVLAIYFKGKIDITLMDSLNKRILFLMEVKEKLGLDHVTIIHGRAEELAHKAEYREKYDVAVARAVANLSVLLEYEIGYLKIGGHGLFMKGDNVQTEIENCKNTFKVLNASLEKCYSYCYKVSEEEYHRNILDIKKKDKTPNHYPRNAGKIKKSALN